MRTGTSDAKVACLPAPAETTDVAFPSAIICIDLDLDLLTWPKMAKLFFLEVGCDPDVIERYDVNQLLSDVHALSAFDTSLDNDSSNRGPNDGVAKVELSLVHFRLALEDA